jgi:fatty acid desaturase
LLTWAGFSPLLYVLGVAYPATSILLIRSFAEHRASEHKEHRTAIIPDRGPLALLFLNNNLHAVHHTHPTVPWYRLPQLFRENRNDFLRSNGGYGYRNYLEVFARHWRKPLDSISHPLWNRSNRTRPLPGQSDQSSSTL